MSRERIWPGAHVNAMGSDAPGKQELDPALVVGAKLVADRREQSMAIGELQQRTARGLMRAAELDEVRAGRVMFPPKSHRSPRYVISGGKCK